MISLSSIDVADKTLTRCLHIYIRTGPLGVELPPSPSTHRYIKTRRCSWYSSSIDCRTKTYATGFINNFFGHSSPKMLRTASLLVFSCVAMLIFECCSQKTTKRCDKMDTCRLPSTGKKRAYEVRQLYGIYTQI
jgi:hypothetical protein